MLPFSNVTNELFSNYSLPKIIFPEPLLGPESQKFSEIKEQRPSE